MNIHLFHDASNLVSLESAPSVYSRHRRRALAYVLDRLNSGSNEEEEKLPYFIFGDFNFRLEGRGVVEQLSRGLSKESATSDKDSSKVKYVKSLTVLLGTIFLTFLQFQIRRRL